MYKPHPGKNLYPYLIILLLAAFIPFLIWAGLRAGSHGSRISDPAYYSKGLKYNNTRIEERAAASRGWQLKTDILLHQLLFQLQDADSKPIQGALGELTLYQAREQKTLRFKPIESAPGLYRFTLPSELSGSMQANVEFSLQGARISRQLLVNF